MKTLSKLGAGLFLAITFNFAGITAALAGVSSQFPDPAQVAVDYPDDADRYTALNMLWDYLHAKAAYDPEARAKRASYYDAATVIRQRHLIAGEADATAFDERVRQDSNRSFNHDLLARYHLTQIAAEAPPPPPLQSHDVTDDMIKGAFLRASPFAIAALVLMYLVCNLLLRFTSPSGLRIQPPPPLQGNIPPLPESLRVVRLPGESYSLDVASGMVLEKETVVHHQTTTTTRPADPYHGPAQTFTNTTSTKVDTLWMRSLDGRESAWTLTSSPLQTRAGHLITGLGPRWDEGNLTFMKIYNHTTGQFVDVTKGPHGTKSCLAGWISFFIATIGFAIGIAIIVSLQPPDDPMYPLFAVPVALIMASIPAAIAALIVWSIAGGRITRHRNRVFERNYAPGLRQYLEQLTPYLRQHYGV